MVVAGSGGVQLLTLGGWSDEVGREGGGHARNNGLDSGGCGFLVNRAFFHSCPEAFEEGDNEVERVGLTKR